MNNSLARVTPEQQVYGFTPLELQMLAYPFQRWEHQFLQGMVYIRKEALSNRIDKVDPNWQFTLQRIEVCENSVNAVGLLIIKGVARSDGGGGTIQRTKKDGSQVAEAQVAENIVNAHKSAYTDAFKRCCQKFAMGRYFAGAPKEGPAFDQWLAALLTDASVRYKAAKTEAIIEVSAEVVEDD